MKPTEKSSNTLYRPDIDGLRAIAISSVVAYHAGLPGFSGGFVGVDVFLVISGFLITRLLAIEIENTGSVSFSKFYARRFKRLLPAFLFMVLGTLLLVLCVTPGLEDSKKFAASLRWSVIGLGNLFFQRNTGGYFDGPSEEMPLLHLWSLSVEEQFYLAWPLLLMLPIWISRRIKVPKKTTLAILSGVTLASFFSALALVRLNKDSEAFFLTPFRAWELGMGGLLAFFQKPKVTDQWSRSASFILAPVGLCAIFYGITSYDHQTRFPGLTALAPVLGTAGVILSGALSTNPINRFLSNRLFTKIGVLSYGWYLWHWPFLSLLKLWNLGTDASSLGRVLAALVALLVAEFSLRWIETPMKQASLWKTMPPVRVILIGLGVSILVGLIGFKFGIIEDHIISGKIGAGVLKKLQEQSSLGGRCFTKNEVGSPTCTIPFAKDSAQTRELAIWGDSHACSYFPMIELLGLEQGLNVTQYCQGQTLPFYSDSDGDFASAVFRDLKKKTLSGKKLSLVLVARWVPYTNKTPISLETHHFPNFGNESESLIEIKKRLMRTLTELKLAGVDRVMIVLPYPEFKYRTQPCLLRNIEPCETPLAEVQAYQKAVSSLLIEVSTGESFVRLLDPMSVVCPGDRCPQILDGIPITSDTNHPTVAAVKWITRKKSTELTWLY